MLLLVEFIVNEVPPNDNFSEVLEFRGKQTKTPQKAGIF
jgi:hypothetical protein